MRSGASIIELSSPTFTALPLSSAPTKTGAASLPNPESLARGRGVKSKHFIKPRNNHQIGRGIWLFGYVPGGICARRS